MKTDTITLIGTTSSIDRELVDGSVRGSSFPGSPNDGDIFELTEPAGQYLAGLYVYSLSYSDWVVQADKEDFPYDIALSSLGRPAKDSIMARFVATRSFNIHQSFKGSLAEAIVPASVDAIITINVRSNGRDRAIGTISFLAGELSGVFTALEPGNMLVLKGDSVSIESPILRDDTLSDVAITLAASLTLV